jgi:hypothetical protein
MMATPSLPKGKRPSIRAAITWGVVVGVLQAASPLGFWRLDPATDPVARFYSRLRLAAGRNLVPAVEAVRVAHDSTRTPPHHGANDMKRASPFSLVNSSLNRLREVNRVR